MQDCRSKQRTTSLDSRARSTSAASATMSSLTTPRDETETEEGPFAYAGSGSESDEKKNEDKGEHFKVNVHALSSDDDAVIGEETDNDEAETNMSTDQARGDEEILPRLTSMPVSDSAENFKIVDIENRGNIIFPISGDVIQPIPPCSPAMLIPPRRVMIIPPESCPGPLATPVPLPTPEIPPNPDPVILLHLREPQLQDPATRRRILRKFRQWSNNRRLLPLPGFPQKRTHLLALLISPF
jgi:hypothetical protein